MNLLPINSEMIKLCNVQVNIEKSILSLLEHLRNCTEIKLNELSKDLIKEREDVRKLLQSNIKDVWEPLKDKMTLIENKQLGHITDFTQFKREMINIQDNIQNLKHENKKQIELLEREVYDLSVDVNYYNERMPEWLQPLETNSQINIEKTKGIKNTHQCKEVKEFMDFIHSSGGHENGWRQEYHYLFIKFRKKFKNIDVIAQKLHEELPDISEEEIKKHEDWYQKYVQLEISKRNALKAWQKEKKTSKAVSKKYSTIPSKVAAVIQSQPSIDIQEKLLKWKALKEERTRTAKRIELQNKQKKDETEHLRMQRNEELKMLVNEWKQNRHNFDQLDLAENKIEAEQEKRRRASEANKLIKQFQSQDDLYILKMKQRRKPEPFSTVRSKSSYSAKRDPKRLLKPTQQWINRVHDENPSDNFGKILPLRCLPKLGVPEWRRQIH